MGRKAKNRIKYDNIDSTPDENIDPEWQKKQDDMVKKEEEYNRQMGVLEIRRKMMDYIEENCIPLCDYLYPDSILEFVKDISI